MRMLVSFCTPTFNRAHLLHRVFNSLVSQERSDLEWVVIDDGSTDGTKELIDSYRAKAGFPVRYYYQVNSGKHAAINKGVSVARGDYFVMCDSDDAFTNNVVSVIREYDSIIRGRGDVCGVISNVSRGGVVFGKRLPVGELVSYSDLVYYHRNNCEKWSFIKTIVMREFLFPVTRGSAYLPEGVVWARLGAKYKFLCINEVLREYYATKGSIVRSKRSIKEVAPNKFLFYDFEVRNHANLFWRNPVRGVINSALFVRYGLMSGKGFNDLFRGLSLIAVAWVILLFPLGLVMGCIDRINNEQ